MAGFSLLGVNLSGAEYNPGATLEGTNYIYPSDAEIDYYASKGMNVIRLPFLLERVEPVAGGPLNTTELGYIDQVVAYAATKGIDVILDPHDYGTEYGTVIGTTAASNATFANFWGELATHFASTPNVMFGLMNEPNAVTPAQWLVSANAAIAAIRTAGATTQQILVPGTYWDTASSFVSTGNAQVLGNGIVDPSHNFAFEVHQYLDAGQSGTSSTVVSTTIGVERLTAITQWAEATGNKLFLGEFGVASDSTSLTAMNNMLNYMSQHTDVWEGGTYWAAGPWWGNYMYSIEPTNGVDKPQMAVLEQYLTTTTTTIESFGSINLLQVGNNYYFGTAGPELKYFGSAVVAGQFSPWVPVAAEQTSTGFDFAWKMPGSDNYTVWSTDSSGNYLTNLTGIVSGASAALEALETTFHQDLNGDGVIGLPTTTIESSGSTSLLQVGNNYYFGTTGPELKYFGSAVVAGQFSPWAPIAAEQTSTGFDFAWKMPGSDNYTVWSTDSSGNYLTNLTGIVSGASVALEALETTFHQDLNGDGVIGLPTTTIESSGSTSLLQVGNNYYFGTTGPELKYFGSAVVAGQFSPWAPIAAEQTSTGFDFAWKMPGSDNYTVWSTDSSGNYLTNLTGIVSGASAALEALETTFHQDLNGDGVTGLPTTTIESSGSTSLLQVGNNYYLGTAGPELNYFGSAVVAGQFSPWVPIAAEQTSTGFDFAWKMPGSDNYTVWSTDSSGNYLTNMTGIVSGASAALEALETTFHQDLNGDGVIGLPTTTIESSGSTSLLQVGNNYYFGTTGPELKYFGSAVVAGQFSPWAPIAAEQTSTGFDFAWKMPGSDNYTVWSTDSSGNYLTNLTGIVSGASAALEALETTFHQDLNGDGVIGLVEPIAAGATVELAGTVNEAIKFNSTTGNLLLDRSTIFTDQIYGFSGNGTLEGSAHLDLKDIVFASGVTESYTGTTSGGTLTVSDGQNDTAHIALVGDYVSSTFTVSGDGHGGTTVIDPATPDQVSGTLSFSATSSDQHSVEIAPAEENTIYLGNFTVGSPQSSASGQVIESFHFNFDASAVDHTTTQSYNVSLTDQTLAGVSQSTSQTVSVTIGGPANDSFVFHAGIGTDIVANAKATDTFNLQGFASIANSSQLSELLHEAQTGQDQSVFASTNNGHDTTINLGNHDSITLTNIQLAALHASNFIIG